MRVSPNSPVEDKQSFLYKWDTCARQYFSHFEIHKNSTRKGINALYSNFLTSWRDPILYRNHYQKVDLLTYRQLLGDISKEEVKDLNKVFKGQYYFTKSRSEPASIFAWRWMQFAGLTAMGWGLMIYTKFVKGYNILWFVAPFLPFWTYFAYNYSRQPHQELENCYKYLLAKRAATCEYEQNRQKFLSDKRIQTHEYKQLQDYLKTNNISLYQLEADLVNRIHNGNIR